MKKQAFACSLKVTSQIRGQKALAKGHHGVPWKDLATLLANRDFHCSISWYLSKENCYEFQPTKETHILDFRQRSVDFLEPITRSGGGRGQDEEKTRDKKIYIYSLWRWVLAFYKMQSLVLFCWWKKQWSIHKQIIVFSFFGSRTWPVAPVTITSGKLKPFTSRPLFNVSK